MMTETGRPHSQTSRQLLDLAVEARLQYADYLRAVASGERPADPAEKEQLKATCDEALKAWREIHRAWRDADWLPRRPTSAER